MSYFSHTSRFCSINVLCHSVYITDGDFIFDSSMLVQSFQPPEAAPVCFDLEAAVDGFVEENEMLTVRVESVDRAVIPSDNDEDRSIDVTIIDFSPGKLPKEFKR